MPICCVGPLIWMKALGSIIGDEAEVQKWSGNALRRAS